MGSIQLFDLDFGSVARILNLLDPLAAQEPATKAYVDQTFQGLAWKDDVRVASTGNISLAAPGATLDGVTMAANDRFLAKNQTTTTENGIYVYNGAAVPATRASDADVGSELKGAVVTATEGTANAGTTWRQTASGTITLGTTPIAWTNFGVVAAPASETVSGIAEIATQAETDAGTDDLRFVTPLKLANYSGRAKRYAASIGDGSSTQIDVTHNLGTKDIVVMLRRNSDDVAVVAKVTALSTTVARVNFALPPASNAIRFVAVA